MMKNDDITAAVLIVGTFTLIVSGYVIGGVGGLLLSIAAWCFMTLYARILRGKF